jgi:hypothetical protein
MLLQSLRLVSLAEFEQAIQDSIARIVSDTTGRIAVFPVEKIHSSSRLPSSAQKIGYTLTNLERLHSMRLRVRPSVESMRAEKMKHVILVDDLIGTGGRIVKFWDEWADKSLKSWLSYHKCQLWVVAFAGHHLGVQRVLERITYLDETTVRLTLPLPSFSSYPRPEIPELMDKYAHRTSKSTAARGVGGCMSHIIFQHGCSNNAPALLWANGRHWKAIFPNRSIPPQLYVCFGDIEEGTRNAELLWSAGQYRLALELINAAHTGTKAQSYQLLLTVLGLLARHVISTDLPKLMTVSEERINTVIARATKIGLLDCHTQITAFGRDILERVRRGQRSEDLQLFSSSHAAQLYYPLQCFGVRRKSSNEPVPNP